MSNQKDKDVHIHKVRVPRKIKYVKILRADDTLSAEKAEFESFDESAFDELEEQEQEQPAISVEDLEQATREAYEQGFEEGKTSLQPMVEEAMKEQELIKNSFESIFANLHQEYRTSEKGMEDTAVRLGMMIAETILRREVLQDSTIVVTQVRKALQELYDVETVKIHVHTSHVEALEKIQSVLVSEQNTVSGMQIIGNDAVELGGCILETDIGRVDATISTQLQKIGVQLDDAVHSKENSEEFVEEQPKPSRESEEIQERTSYDVDNTNVDTDSFSGSLDSANSFSDIESEQGNSFEQKEMEQSEFLENNPNEVLQDIASADDFHGSTTTEEQTFEDTSQDYTNDFDDISADELEALLGDDFEGLE